MDVLKSASKVGVLLVVAAFLCAALMLLASCGGGAEGKDGQVKAPLSSSSAEDKNYEDIKLQFEKAGFTNVSTEGLGDLITGLMHKEGEVKEVSVDGKTNYSTGAWYDPDAKVVIRYHSYPEKSSSSSTSVSSSSSSSKTTSSTASSSPAAAAQQSESPKIDVSGYVDQPLLFVCDDLKARGVPFKLIHEITQMDMTSAYEYGDFDDADMIVTAAKADSDGSVTLTIISESLASEQRGNEAGL